MPASNRTSKREALNIRIRPNDRDLIDRAAELTGKTRTDFVIDAARHAAGDALLDRSLVVVDAKAYRQFLARLDAPAKPNKRLLKTLKASPPWD